MITMYQPLISVIVPIFNSELYLKKCIDSIVNQTYKNIEIVCINDGSTDSSIDILNEFKKNDFRIKVINQQNKGISVARNTGIEKSTGEWVAFVDSDDYIETNLLENFCKILNNSDFFDIYCFNGYIVPKNHNETSENLQKFFYANNWKTKTDNLYKFSDCKNPFWGNLSIWNKIYRRNFLLKHNIKCKENSIFEDQLFVIKAMIKANNIYLDDRIFYYYIQHEKSIMHTLKQSCFDIFDTTNDIKKLLFEFDLYENNKYNFLQHKYNVFGFLLVNIDKSLRKKFFLEAKKNLKEEYRLGFDENIIKRMQRSVLLLDFIMLDFEEFAKKYEMN